MKALFDEKGLAVSLSAASCASTHDDFHTASSSRTRAIPLASHTDECRDRTGIERRRGGKSARSHHSPRRMVLHLSSMAGLAGRPCSLCICASFGRLMERKEKNHLQRSTHAHLLTAPCRSHAHTRRWLSACARRASPTGTYRRMAPGPPAAANGSNARMDINTILVLQAGLDPLAGPEPNEQASQLRAARVHQLRLHRNDSKG